jgi:hypothetical protein
MSLVQKVQCDVCLKSFPMDGTVRKLRLHIDGQIRKSRQPLGDKPNVIEASTIDHDDDLGIEDACVDCRDALRELIRKLQVKRRTK